MYSRRKYYLMLATFWLYMLAPFAAGGVFLYLTGEVPLVLQVLILAWLISVVFFTPSLPELFTSYDKYVEEWRKENEQQRNS